MDFILSEMLDNLLKNVLPIILVVTGIFIFAKVCNIFIKIIMAIAIVSIIVYFFSNFIH